MILKKVTYLVFVILILVSCKSSSNFNGYAYENNIPSIQRAIGSAAQGAKTPAKGLEVMDTWIARINSPEMKQSDDAKKELLSLCYRYKADAYQILGAYNLAFDNYQKAIELDDNNTNAHFNLGVLYSGETDQRDKALDEFNLIIKRKPDFADAYFARGKVNENMGSYVEAVVDYAKAIELDDTNQEYKDNKTVMYMRLHKSADAIIEASQLIHLFPYDAEAYQLRANSYYMAQEYNKALEDYDKLIELAPAHAFYSLRANCLEVLKEYAKALEDYTQALDTQDGNNSHIYSSRGKMYAMLGRYDEALVDQNRAVNLLPDIPVPYAYRGYTRLVMKDYEKAISDYTFALGKYPSAEYYRFRGNAYRGLKLYREAFEDYNKAIEVCPEMWGTYKASIFYDRGVAFYETNDYEKALTDFYKAREIDPEDKEDIKSSITEYIDKIEAK